MPGYVRLAAPKTAAATSARRKVLPVGLRSRLACVLAAAAGASNIAPALGICDNAADLGKTQLFELEHGGYPLQVLCGDDAAAAAAKAATDRKTAMDDAEAVQSLARKMQEAMEKKVPDYKPPDLLDRSTKNERNRVLRTAGMYSRRAMEHSRNGEYKAAVADLLRALLRPGLDPSAEIKLSKALKDFLAKAKKKRDEAAKDGDLSELFEAFDIEDDGNSLDDVDFGQLKKLYRKLSVKYHPDKSPANAARFAKVRDAYEILTDPVKVLLYDTGGLDLVKKFEGGTRDLERTDSIEHTAHVTLKDIYMGLTKNITVGRRVVCRSCRLQPNLPRCKKCQQCPGEKGQRQRFMNQMQFVIEEYEIPSPEKCAQTKSSFNIVIERGMLTGDRISHPHKADQKPKRVPGDVTVTIQVEQHPYFKRVQNDLIVTVRVSLYEALLGFERELVHLDGHTVRFSVARGDVLKPGAGLEIPGEGMPLREDPSSYGRLLVMFEIQFPKKVSDKAAASLETAFAELGMGPGEVRLKGKGLKRLEL